MINDEHSNAERINSEIGLRCAAKYFTDKYNEEPGPIERRTGFNQQFR